LPLGGARRIVEHFLLPSLSIARPHPSPPRQPSIRAIQHPPAAAVNASARGRVPADRQRLALHASPTLGRPDAESSPDQHKPPAPPPTPHPGRSAQACCTALRPYQSKLRHPGPQVLGDWPSRFPTPKRSPGEQVNVGTQQALLAFGEEKGGRGEGGGGAVCVPWDCVCVQGGRGDVWGEREQCGAQRRGIVSTYLFVSICVI